MKTVLDTGHTWFLEACSQLPSGELHIRLAEGIKGRERLPVQIGDQALGPYFPVTIGPASRAVEVRFPYALALFTYNESYDAKDPDLTIESRTVLRRVNVSSFRKYVAANTTAFELGKEPLTEWLLWTENQVFQLIASGDPQVVELPNGPDLSIERYQTWSAS
ncbi:hypothetical protein [Pseudoxanthomonas sp. GM95]|uniref:hypothetical protein n=1 Tax=Pseudoxanthomonas sp. GM95 TaxID=1881043 RepID=UPI0011138457|nr:hypothetical protein [Pseudoxanthomonas sp. GM95]